MRREKIWRLPRRWTRARPLSKRLRASWLSPKAKLSHDQSLFDYSRITAPFSGVVTERYANLGTLVQAGTGSSTQAMPAGEAFAGRFVPPGDSGSRVVCALHPDRRSGQCSRAFAESDFSREGGAIFSGRAIGHTHHAHRSGCSESQAVLFPAFMQMRSLSSTSKDNIPPSPSRR